MSFQCTQCGLCCKYVYRALDKSKSPKWTHQAIDDFPYKMRPDGSCEKLVNNQCSVYDDRPTMCNINAAHDRIDMPMTKEEWYAMNTAGCESLMREENTLKLRVA